MKKYILAALLLAGSAALTVNFSLAQMVGSPAPEGDNKISMTCTNLTYNLKLGSSDKYTSGQVTDLQMFLVALNILNAEPTGYFGNATVAAVKTFQSRQNLTSSGYVGTYTRAAIKSISCTTSTVDGSIGIATPTPTNGATNSVIASQAPRIQSISPSSGPLGTRVTITGTGFASTNTIRIGQTNVTPYISEIAANCNLILCQSLTFTFPATYTNTNYQNGISVGTYDVSVKNTNGISNSVSFTVTASSSATCSSIYCPAPAGTTCSSGTSWNGTSCVAPTSSAPTTMSAPKVEFVGTPTLSLQYDSLGKESKLVGKGTVKITTGSTAIHIFPGSVAGTMFFYKGDSQALSNSMTLIATSPIATDPYTEVTLQANTSYTFSVVNTAKTSELFSGVYTLRPTNFNYSSTDNAHFYGVPSSLFTNARQSNSVTIIGETSPYISNVPTNPNGTVSVIGQRLNLAGNYLQIDGAGNSMISKFSPTATSFTFDPSVYQLSAGTHTIQITNATYGASNKAGFTSGVSTVCSSTSCPPSVPAVTASLFQSESSTLAGVEFSIKLTSTNATSCTVNYTGPDGGGVLSSGPTNGTKNFSPYVVGTYTVTAICMGSAGTLGSSPITHVVTSPAAPSISLTTSSSTVQSGGKATLLWSTTPSSGISCVAAGGNLGAGMTINPNGSWTTPALYTTTEYGIRCSDNTSGLSSTKYVVVNVTNLTSSTASAAPSISLSANTIIPYGTPATIVWSVFSQNISSVRCIAAGGEIPSGYSVSTNGYWKSSNLYTTTQYGIQCVDSSNGLVSNKYTTVTVSQPSTPVVNLTQSSDSTVSGTQFSLKLSSSNATSCTVTYTGPDGGGTLSTGSTSGIKYFSPTVIGTYVATATCTGNGGTKSSSVTHMVTKKTTTTTTTTTTTSATSAPTNTTTDSCAALDASLYCTTESCTTNTGAVRYGTKSCSVDACAALDASQYCTTQSCTTNTGVIRYGTKSCPTSSMESALFATNSIQASVLGASTSSMCIDLPYNFHRGNESSSVTKLQTFLNTRGLLMDAPTGFFGDKTVAAVKAYQSSKGLPMTGMVYGATRAAIVSDTCQ